MLSRKSAGYLATLFTLRVTYVYCKLALHCIWTMQCATDSDNLTKFWVQDLKLSEY